MGCIEAVRAESRPSDTGSLERTCGLNGAKTHAPR
jgi:hypothetical protein